MQLEVRSKNSCALTMGGAMSVIIWDLFYEEEYTLNLEKLHIFKQPSYKWSTERLFALSASNHSVWGEKLTKPLFFNRCPKWSYIIFPVKIKLCYFYLSQLSVKEKEIIWKF